MRPLSRRLIVLIGAALLSGACGVSPVPEYPTVHGRRAQIATLVAANDVPYRVGAYELVFQNQTGAPQAHRAALLVSLVGGQGHVEGFAEWGRAGESLKIYAVAGWAHQRSVAGQLMTVLDLWMDRLYSPEVDAPARDPRDLRSLAVRVVVNEASGDTTLTRRR